MLPAIEPGPRTKLFEGSLRCAGCVPGLNGEASIMTKQTVEMVIQEFGTAAGAPDMALDEDDFVCFTTPAGVLINVDYYRDDDCLVMYTTVGEIFDDTRMDIYDDLLKANFFWEVTGSATLCVDPEGTHALLVASVTAAGLDVTQLTNVFDRIDQLTQAWAARIHQITRDRVADTTPAPDQGAAIANPAQLA